MSFRLEGPEYAGDEVLDQYYGPDHVFFKVPADDGNEYGLRRQNSDTDGGWELIAFRDCGRWKTWRSSRFALLEWTQAQQQMNRELSTTTISEPVKGGAMKGDFSRDTFDPTKHFSRVLQQQGRVSLDADFNECGAIFLHHLRTLTRDLLGPCATPSGNAGFGLTATASGELHISAGRMYVDGILVENEADRLYTQQPDCPLQETDPLLQQRRKPTEQVFLLYLEVWERHITYLEDDSIREPALGGPDTCTRAKVVWQVKAVMTDLPSIRSPQVREAVEAGPDLRTLAHRARLRSELRDLSKATLAARLGAMARRPAATVSPQPGYAGLENHLYRVEIHEGGSPDTATFKWSRDNGTVVAPWLGMDGNDLRVSDAQRFTRGCWIEVLDDATELWGVPGTLVRVLNAGMDVISIDSATLAEPTALQWSDRLRHPKIRRWDQVQAGGAGLRDGAIPVSESSDPWIELEAGLQIQFGPGGTYGTGDYWLIPARAATGTIEWPVVGSNGTLKPRFAPPRGIEHHYAPLALAGWDNRQLVVRPFSCNPQRRPGVPDR